MYEQRHKGGAWELLQTWGPNDNVIWSTAGYTPGAYEMRASVRKVGNTALLGMATMPVTMAAAPGATLTGNPAPANPPSAGTPVLFTAGVTGGSGSFEYEFLGSVDGVNFMITRDFSPDPNWSWGTAPGSYFFKVNVRNAGTTGPVASSTVVNYSITEPAPSGDIVASLSGLPASPTTAGTVEFTAEATGGSGSFEYEFVGSVDGVNFIITRDYSTDPNWTWGTAPGNYFFKVNVRNAGSTSAATSEVLTYTIN
jgi:hypothetical protein